MLDLDSYKTEKKTWRLKLPSWSRWLWLPSCLDSQNILDAIVSLFLRTGEKILSQSNLRSANLLFVKGSCYICLTLHMLAQLQERRLLDRRQRCMCIYMAKSSSFIDAEKQFWIPKNRLWKTKALQRCQPSSRMTNPFTVQFNINN